MIDPTKTGGKTATGQLKSNFLRGWADGSFLQVFAPREEGFPVVSSLDPSSKPRVLSAEDVLAEIASFDPELLYYRPTIDQHPRLHELATQLLDRNPLPLVTHLMDDWPARLTAEDPALGRKADRDLRSVLARSAKLLSISEKMSRVYADRYGMPFEPIANGVDIRRYAEARAAAAPVRRQRQEVVLRYCGALARDMTFQTIVDVARAVDSLQDELPVAFEVYTMPMWREDFEQEISGLKGTTTANGVFGDKFPGLLAEADILVLGYNFDPETERYVALSVPNKLPEYLASGAAILAVGPTEANGIEVVQSAELACCVTKRDPGELVGAIRRLVSDTAYREGLAARGEAWAAERLDVDRVAGRFQSILRQAAAPVRNPVHGPLSRDHSARVDETKVVHTLLKDGPANRIMIDVGAHHGWALQPFAESGWKVFAFEPDPVNRRRLKRRFGERRNVVIDPRAVSDAPAASASFFKSDESSGISALHAFRESHKEVDTVSVTTVAEVVERRSIGEVSFLKIDVEGFDWNVLKGVPWDRMRPAVVECEFEDAKTHLLGHTYREVCDYLVERGYTVYLSEWHPIERYGVPHDWRQLLRYPADLASDDGWGNILAFRDDPGPERLAAAFSECMSVEPAPVAEEPTTAPDRATEAAPAAVADPESPDARGAGPDEALSFVGRFGAWLGRKAQRYPLLALLLLAGLCGLIAAGFAFADDPLGPVLWAVAGICLGVAALVVTAGFVGFLVKEARHDLEMQNLHLRRSLETATNTLTTDQREASRGFEAKLEALEAGQRSAGKRLDAKLTSLEQDHRSQRSASGRLEERLESANTDLAATKAWLAEEQQAGRAEMEKSLHALEGRHDAEKAGLGVRISALEGELSEAANRLEAKLGALEGEQRAARASLAVEIGGLDASLGSIKETAKADKDALLAEMQEFGSGRESIEARIEELANEGAATQEARAQLVSLEERIEEMRAEQAAARQ
ncbi:MAG TPA: FkbM family methyltransferase, partial [Solirubrobacterales bacterium]|nr:FkbM family methyltransferase [Solirubrobacterales bacterium]